MKEINYFKTMEPMKYYDNPEPKTGGAKKKREEIICGSESKKYIATRKFDGDWGCFIHYNKDNNLIRSRSISKVTGEYGNYTEKLPSLVEKMNQFLPDNTCFLGEICLSGENQTANTIGTILRCLPAKAIERQKTTPVAIHIFDLLMWNGEDYSELPYEKRLNLIKEKLNTLCDDKTFFMPVVFDKVDDFATIADQIINLGGEGLVLQLRTNSYMAGTRTAWKTLKLKQCLPHMDLKVIATLEPQKNYDGICLDNWSYFKDGVAVTKPYYMGWKNGIIVDFNDTQVSVTSGLSDEDREWLATTEAQEMINKGALYAEVKAMSVNSRDSLRHPALVRLRPDYDGAAEN
jgi:ATP-dependent DNA ligase